MGQYGVIYRHIDGCDRLPVGRLPVKRAATKKKKETSLGPQTAESGTCNHCSNICGDCRACTIRDHRRL